VVVADAQVPGPGRRRPMPRNVATSVATCEVRSVSGLSIALWIVVVRIVRFKLLIGTSHRRRNHVSPARPLAQVNHAASLAAERKFGVGSFDGFLADWASKLEGAFADHNAGNQLLLRIKLKMKVLGFWP
jgi:hypothetical protein